MESVEDTPGHGSDHGSAATTDSEVVRVEMSATAWGNSSSNNLVESQTISEMAEL